jgi:hypothetical protein
MKRIYLVSDLADFLTPGLLCREYLLSICAPDTPVLMANAKKETRQQKLGDMFPYPSLYIRMTREQMVDLGKELRVSPETLAAQLAKLLSESGGSVQVEASAANCEVLVRSVFSAVALDWKDDLHPMRYAAGVLFEDGDVKSSHQQKALEYGSSLDPGRFARRGVRHSLFSNQFTQPPVCRSRRLHLRPRPRPRPHPHPRLRASRLFFCLQSRNSRHSWTKRQLQG